MRKISFGSLLIFAILFITQINANIAEAQSNTYPIRELTLDTLGKTILLNEDSSNTDGKLYELSNGAVIKNWKVKYEQKGSMRQMCEPPVLNVSFDKYDSKGRPKQLFNGVSTYENYGQLQYQKIRLIPECDGWNDYSRSDWSSIGFKGQLNVTLREYIVFKIFRAFDIPTADIIGFANVTFITPDSGYEGKTFRYMIVQRPAEQDDQIPFTTQYNLDPHLYESGDYESGNRQWDYTGYNKIISATLNSLSDGTSKTLNFDIKTSMRYSLLTDFLKLSDMAPLHNEDWGVNLQTGLVKVIPHGFDASLIGCEIDNPEYIELLGLFRALPESLKADYSDKLYEVSRELFGSPSSLQKMLALVDDFPYRDTNKSLLKQYIRVNYYSYAKYFNSKDFYDLIEKVYTPQDISFPFISDEEYIQAKDSFLKSCNQEKLDPEYSVSIVNRPKIDTDPNNSESIVYSVEVEVRSKDEPLQMLKSENGGPFLARLVGEYKDNDRGLHLSYQITSGEFEDSVGPYYTIPPHSKIRLLISQNISDFGRLKDNYYVHLIDFKPNYKFKSSEFNLKSDIIKFGAYEPIVLLSPLEDEKINVGQSYGIKWEGSPHQPVNISVISEDTGRNWSISNPNTEMVFEDNVFNWIAGNSYQWDSELNKFVIEVLEPGRYRVEIRDSQSGLGFESKPFILNDSNSTPPDIKIIGIPKLSLQYDKNGDEEILISTFDVFVEAGSKDQKISIGYGFLSSIEDKNGSRIYRDKINITSTNLENDNSEYFTIKAGTSATFNVQSFFNPKIMFAGVYSGLLPSVWLGNQSSLKEYSLSKATKTNELVIIGEKSPYVSSVSPDDVPGDGLLTINGVRFSTIKPNQVTLDDPYSDCPDDYTCSGHRRYDVISKDEKTLEFIPNIEAGSYILQVTHPETGQSNRVWIQISNPTSVIKPSVTPNKEKITSGESVTLNYIVPKGTVSTSLMLYCPNGVKAIDEKSKNICNGSVSLGQNPSHTTFTLSSTANWPQYVVPNFYIYYENDPNFAVGVSSQITVLPASLSTTTATSTDASATSTGLIGRIIDSAQGILTSTIRTITSVIRPNPSPTPTISITPAPSPSITPKTSPSTSSSVSPRPSVSISPTPVVSTTVSPRPSPSISPKVIPTPTVRPSLTPTPSSIPRPSSTPIPTTSPTPSYTPPATPTPTPTPITTPTPVSTPSPIATPTPTPISTPSQSPSSNSSPVPSTEPSPTPTATPAPSNSPAPSPSPSPFSYSKKMRTANTFEAYMRMIGIIR